MGGICCRQIHIVVAGIALNRRPAKTVVHMALQAWDCIVRPSSRKLRLVVIKARLPGCCGYRMALGAIRVETRGAVIDNNRIIIISGVAGKTCPWRAGEVQIDVAVLARGRAMLSNQYIAGLRVVEFHGICQCFPSVRRMTIRTLVRQLTMRRFLRECLNAAQENDDNQILRHLKKSFTPSRKGAKIVI